MCAESVYFNPSHPGSFGGVDRLHKYAKLSKSVAKNFLLTQPVYTKNKAARHKFPRRKIVVPTANYLWQTDLIILNKYARENAGMKYILTCIDVLSRYAYAIPLKFR